MDASRGTHEIAWPPRWRSILSSAALEIQVPEAAASFIGDDAYDQEGVSAAEAEHHPEAAVIVPARATAVPSKMAQTVPTQRDCHLQHIAEHGRRAWQNASGYTKRARAEAGIGRFKQVIGGELRLRMDERRATEVNVAVHALNRMLESGRPHLRPYRLTSSGVWGECARTPAPCNTLACSG
jgi:hypothetical protein